jgi:hypothetical protein
VSGCLLFVLCRQEKTLDGPCSIVVWFVLNVVSAALESKAWTLAEAASGLPRDLHLALLAAMMLSELGGSALENEE